MPPCSTGSGRFKELTIELCQREKSGGGKETASQVKERSLITGEKKKHERQGERHSVGKQQRRKLRERMKGEGRSRTEGCRQFGSPRISETGAGRHSVTHTCLM